MDADSNAASTAVALSATAAGGGHCHSTDARLPAPSRLPCADRRPRVGAASKHPPPPGRLLLYLPGTPARRAGGPPLEAVTASVTQPIGIHCAPPGPYSLLPPGAAATAERHAGGETAGPAQPVERGPSPGSPERPPAALAEKTLTTPAPGRTATVAVTPQLFSPPARWAHKACHC